MENFDAVGAYGAMFQSSCAFFFMGSALLIFFYLWKRGRLDMDEVPKYQMMQDEEGE